MGRQVTIYALRDESGVRYVGQTVQELERYLRNHPVAKQLRQEGATVMIEALEVVMPQGANDAETRWIEVMKARGCRLVNKYPGGRCRIRAAEVVPDPKITVVMPKRVLRAIKQRAARIGVTPSGLIRMWVLEELEKS